MIGSRIIRNHNLCIIYLLYSRKPIECAIRLIARMTVLFRVYHYAIVLLEYIILNYDAQWNNERFLTLYTKYFWLLCVMRSGTYWLCCTPCISEVFNSFLIQMAFGKLLTSGGRIIGVLLYSDYFEDLIFMDNKQVECKKTA